MLFILCNQFRTQNIDGLLSFRTGTIFGNYRLLAVGFLGIILVFLMALMKQQYVYNQINFSAGSFLGSRLGTKFART